MTFPASSPDGNRNATIVVFDSVAKTPFPLTGSSLTNANALHVAIVDGGGTQITSFGGGSQFAMGSSQSSSANGTIALGYDGTNVRGVLVNSSGRLQVDVVSGGGSNSSVGSTGAGVPSSATYIGFNSGGNLTAVTLGQQTAANSIPVILPSATITTLTPPSNTGYALDASLSTIDTDLKANITLHAGSNLIGKAGIDQTTPGTTNAVSIAQIGASTLSLGQNTMANSIPVTFASNQSNLNVVTPTGISDKLASVGSFTITLASLASTTAPPGTAGRQSTLVDNTSNLYIGAKVYLKLKMGTSPTANTLVYVFLIQYDNSAVADDSAGASDAALTPVNATLLGTILVNSATTGNSYTGVFDTTKIVDSLGPKWGIAIVNTTGAALDSTEGNHTKNWIGIKRQLN